MKFNEAKSELFYKSPLDIRSNALPTQSAQQTLRSVPTRGGCLKNIYMRPLRGRLLWWLIIGYKHATPLVSVTQITYLNLADCILDSQTTGLREQRILK